MECPAKLKPMCLVKQPSSWWMHFGFRSMLSNSLETWKRPDGTLISQCVVSGHSGSPATAAHVLVLVIRLTEQFFTPVNIVEVPILFSVLLLNATLVLNNKRHNSGTVRCFGLKTWLCVCVCKPSQSFPDSTFMLHLSWLSIHWGSLS